MLMVKGASSYVSSMTTGSVSSGQGGVLFGAVTAAAATTIGMSMVASKFLKDGAMGGASLLKDMLSGGKHSNQGSSTPSSILSSVNSGNNTSSFGGFKGKGGLDGNTVPPNKSSSNVETSMKNAVSTPNSNPKMNSPIANNQNNNIKDSASSNSSGLASTSGDVGNKIAESNNAGGLNDTATNTGNITSSSIFDGHGSDSYTASNGLPGNPSSSSITASGSSKSEANIVRHSGNNSANSGGSNMSTNGAKLEAPLQEMGSNSGGENKLDNKENLKRVEPSNKNIDGKSKQSQMIKAAEVLGKVTRGTVSHVVKHGSAAVSGIANEVSKFGKHISK
jgi:hypothetical protein